MNKALLHADNKIMDLFRYFCGRDIMLEASRVPSHNADNANTLVERDNEDLETESILHDDVSGDVLSNCEMFYSNLKATNVKEVYGRLNSLKRIESTCPN